MPPTRQPYADDHVGGWPMPAGTAIIALTSMLHRLARVGRPWAEAAQAVANAPRTASGRMPAK